MAIKMMDAVLLSVRDSTLDGLRDMMAAACDDGDGLVSAYVNVADALLILEAAKRADDKPGWFPGGKWATIQGIQDRIDEQLSRLFQH